MPRYSAELNRAVSGTNLTVGSLTADAATPRRSRMIEWDFGCDGAPADNISEWLLARITTAGTNTGVTAQPQDPADVAAINDTGENHTVEPTYTAGQTLYSIPLNQRNSYRWVTPPDTILMHPATASNGFGVRTQIAPGTLSVVTTIVFDE